MKRYELECGYGGNDCLAESADGEYILYDDHVEAMKRIAGAPVAQGLDEACNLIAHAIMYLDEGEPGNAKRGLTDVLALIAQSVQSATTQSAEPVAWWNGIRKFDPDRDSVPPSFSADEDTWHDIPLYSGFNPCNSAAPAPSASPADPRMEALAAAERQVEESAARRKEREARLGLSGASPAALTVPEGFAIKHVEGHGWIIDPPSGSRWIAHEGTPAGDFMAALLSTTAPGALTDEVLARVCAAYRQEFACVLNHEAAMKAARAELLAAAPADQVEDARDAARYRWLRHAGQEFDNLFMLDERGLIIPEKMDRAIDAAIAAKEPK